ncbi:MAG: hypothetical protein IJJ80_00735 [Clostridia bacterium]|nr:hypothetical protein [Clostridia bacterium]
MSYSVWLTVLLLIAAFNSPLPLTPAPQAAEGNTIQQAAAEASGYWLGSFSEETVGRYDTSALRTDGANLTTVSVSPSGKYIAAVDRTSMSLEKRHAAGVGNPMGRLPEAICLFARQDDGYSLSRTIPVDAETQLELSSILGGGAAMAWNGDETRCVISYQWGAGSETNAYINNFHSNLYLLDLSDGSLRRLTDNSEACEHCVLPAWSGPDTVRYVRLSNRGGFMNVLCEIDLNTGRETKLADLYSAGGSISVVYDWQAVGERIYYIVDAYTGGTGFYVSPFGGREANARCLVNLMKELRETNRHPYCKTFSQMEISDDGRWACLTVTDQRVFTRDFPTADNPKNPQSDPAHAISVMTGLPWVPCHNVLLYDLSRMSLVDPFRDSALAPEKAVVTAACLAPDGQSMLCAVYGDGRPWSIAEETRTTFYQIDLGDGRFTANRVFETELASSLWFPEGIWWTADNCLHIPTGKAPANPVQILDLGGR